MALTFEWDLEKAEINFKKHGVRFEEAQTVFGDVLARINEDQEHSDDEVRGCIIGMSMQSRILVVAYADRSHNIRLINARKAEPWERRRYENNSFDTTC